MKIHAVVQLDESSISREIFQNVMRIYLENPEIFHTNSILRAEISSRLPTFLDNGFTMERRLVPRIHRSAETVTKQHIEWHDDKHGDVECWFVAAMTSAFYYPKTSEFRIKLCLDALLLTAYSPPHATITDDSLLSSYFDPLLKKLADFMTKQSRNGVYLKRVHHDQLIDRNTYQDLYYLLKNKHKSFVCDIWARAEMRTDHSKHVYEDLNILTFLILLFRSRGTGAGAGSDYFVDLGCGNGLLTYLLSAEGVDGCGIDLTRRSIWDLYRLTNLHCLPIVPSTFTLPVTITPLSEKTRTLWIVANHSDELTPWTPFLGVTLQQQHGIRCNLVIIPCCMYQLDGRKNRISPVMRNGKKIGRYECYLDYVQSLCEDCGYTVERESLRIPSTKNVALVCWAPESFDDETLAYATSVQKSLPFQCRLSDSEKHHILRAKQQYCQAEVCSGEATTSQEWTDALDGFDFDDLLR